MDFTEIRRLTIVGLFSDDVLYEQLVLKGGNAISLIYRIGGRASLDLDFSMDGDFDDVRDTERRIITALARKFAEHGLLVFDGKLTPKPQVAKPAALWWGGYQFEFKLVEKSKYTKLGGEIEAVRRNSVVVGPRQERRFNIDFSKYEYCAGKVEWELDDYTIYVYTPEMIVIEKLRAICQQMAEYALNATKRPRARDFYDIHLLITASKVDLASPEHIAMLRGMFAKKDVPLKLLRNIAGQHELHRLDWSAVRDSVAGEIRDFDFYFEFVLREVDRILEALGVK